MFSPLASFTFLLFFFLVLFISSLCALTVSRLGQRISLVDNPNSRSSHATPTPRGGGVGIWLLFTAIPLLLFSSRFQFILAPFLPRHSSYSFHLGSFVVVAGLFGLLGLVEDRFSLSSKLRLAVQLILSIGAVCLFFSPVAPPLSSIIFLCWIVFVAGTANYYNFMDGINGVAALTGIVGFGLMALFSFIFMKDFDVALLSFILVAACLGFLPLNFPRARVFMGDVGSIFLGFVFASFVVKLSTNISTFLCLVMFLCTFYADATVTIYYRWRAGENLMEAHRGHLYQYMSNEMGLPHWRVSVLYSLIQFTVGILAIWAYEANIAWQIVLIIAYGLLFIGSYNFIKKKTQITVKESAR